MVYPGTPKITDPGLTKHPDYGRDVLFRGGASDGRIQINLDAKETADESALPDLRVAGVFA